MTDASTENDYSAEDVESLREKLLAFAAALTDGEERTLRLLLAPALAGASTAASGLPSVQSMLSDGVGIWAALPATLASGKIGNIP